MTDDGIRPVYGVIGDLRSWAQIYADAGLEIFPVQANKEPYRSQYKATTDAETIDEWWTRWPDALIGHRLAEHHIVLDIDPRHGGLTTWKALKAEVGGLPVTRVHQSGRGDGGGHTWWLRPDDKLSVHLLNQWAQDRDVGHPLDGGKWTAGIDILHRHHRYTILPPSPHPDSGKPYQWLDGRGIDTPPAPLPGLIADLITGTVATPKPPAGPPDPDSIADWYSSTHRLAPILAAAGWQLIAGDGDSDGSRWRHPAATSSCSATVRHGCLFVYSPNTPFDTTEPGDPQGVTPFRAFTVLRHGGDGKAAARAARELKDGPLLSTSVAWITNPNPTAAAETPATPPPTVASHIPDVVWDSRPELAHIRQAARSRLVAPDAVLGSVLTRIAAITPHTVELPATVGAPVGLTYFTALVGSPEAGKSAASAVAAELIPAPANVLDRLPVGSGEGFVEILFDFVEEEDENGKKRKVKRQVRWQAIFQIDEGQALADLGQRSGSTLMPTLRSAWTHGLLGNANASIERRRILDGLNYVYGVTLGIQPELAGPLLADTTGGTPQRFLWVEATDPDAEHHDWPGELAWQPADAALLEDRVVHRRGYIRHQLAVHEDITAQLRNARLDILTGKTTSESGDAHRGLLQLKTAAILALLDCRLDVNLEDWHLADLICTTSRGVRQRVHNTLTVVAAQSENAANARVARRELTVGAAHEAKALQSASRSVANVVHKHSEAAEHEPAGCPNRCLTLAIKSTHRKLVTTDEAAASAVAAGWIKQAAGRWLPDGSRPA